MKLIHEQRAVLAKELGERGVALVVTLLVISLLSLVGFAFLTLSLTETQIARNEVDSSKAFNIAEAGLELGKRTLATSAASSLNQFLTGTTPGPYLFGDTPGAGNSFDGGNYIVRIYDNNDDGDPNNDTDNMVLIESTGSYRNSRRRVVALAEVPLVPEPDGSLEIITSDETEVELEDGALIDGNDWDPPLDPSSCISIATCGTPTGSPAIAGVSSSSTENEVEVEHPSIIEGTPPTKVNTSLSTTPWDNLSNILIPMANRNLSVPEELTGIHTWGTPSAPEITVISGSDIEIEGEINGAGFLIIDNTGELELEHGTLNWQGLILIRGNGELEVEIEDDDDATARIFGALVLMSSGEDAEVELEIENDNSFIKFSRSSINSVRGFLPTTVRSWREVPIQ